MSAIFLTNATSHSGGVSDEIKINFLRHLDKMADEKRMIVLCSPEYQQKETSDACLQLSSAKKGQLTLIDNNNSSNER